MRNHRNWRITLFSIPLAVSVAASGAVPQETETFIEKMVGKHGFEREQLVSLFASAAHRQDIIDAIKRPAEAKPWHEYRKIFVTRDRIEAGAKFWADNAALLARSERKFGVPAEIIVAIIWVETRYGTFTGKYRVLDSLNTLAFGYPKRSGFFRGELEHFLLLAREENLPPGTPKGSYAGAMGKPQFIASSYRSYAIDFDQDGRRDLWNSNADVIGSVANYFARHGWRPGQPIATRAHGEDLSLQQFADAGIKPSIETRLLQQQGLVPEEPLPRDTLVSLIQLDNGRGREVWLGLQNFYVITRYNHSNLYAMAVYQLSQEILRLRERQASLAPLTLISHQDPESWGQMVSRTE